jgi:hypothetical protein
MKPAGLRLKWYGDKARALRPDVVGRGYQQLTRMKHQMSFQKLAQGAVNWLYPDGIRIRTVSFFGVDQVMIEAPPTVSGGRTHREKVYAPITVRDLLLVYGDHWVHYGFEYEDGSPAFVVSDEVDGHPIQALRPLHGYSGIVGNFPIEMSGMITGSLSHAAAELKPPCVRYHYVSGYKDYEVLAGPVFEDEKVYSPISPMEFEPFADVSCEDKDSVLPQTWAKTHDDVTVMAAKVGSASVTFWQRWYIAATYKGRQVTFEGSAVYGGYPYFVFVGFGLSRVLIAFDVWREDATGNYWCCVAEEGRGEGSYSAFELVDGVFLRRTFERFTVLESFPTHNLDNRLRLVGIDGPKHTVYWCRPGELEPGKYYVERMAGDGAGVAPKTIPGKQIVGTLWNHATRELIFATEDIVEEEVQPDIVVWWHHSAKLHRGAPYFCSKYYDTETLMEAGVAGDGCDGFPSTLPGSWTTIDMFGETVPHFIVSDYNRGHYETSGRRRKGGTKYDYGRFSMDQDGYDRGFIIEWNGADWKMKDSYRLSTGGRYAGECEQDLHYYEIMKWMFTLTGHVYKLSVTTYGDKPDPDYSLRTICDLDTPQDYREIEQGSKNVLANAGGWPHNEGWKAILLHGIDRDDQAVGPVIVYDDGYVMSGAGNWYLPDDPHKVFFQSHYETRSIETGEVIWESR